MTLSWRKHPSLVPTLLQVESLVLQPKRLKQHTHPATLLPAPTPHPLPPLRPEGAVPVEAGALRWQGGELLSDSSRWEDWSSQKVAGPDWHSCWRSTPRLAAEPLGSPRARRAWDCVCFSRASRPKMHEGKKQPTVLGIGSSVVLCPKSFGELQQRGLGNAH